MYQLRAFIPWNITEPIVGPYETKAEACCAVSSIKVEGLWFKDKYYFPNWIKRIEIIDLEAEAKRFEEINETHLISEKMVHSKPWYKRWAN